nr:Mu transposase C-terminal domain-containing protein [Microbacterium aquimaris]
MSHTNTVSIGDTLHLDDGDFRIVGFGSGVLKLRHDLTDEYRLVEHLELGVHLAGPKNDKKKEKPVATLHHALEQLNEEARILIPHLQELLDGTPPDGRDPRPQYHARVPVKSRLECKLLELDRLGIDISIATLKRRLSRFKQLGPAGLVDGRGTRLTAPLARADKDVMTPLTELLAEYQGRSTPSVTRLRAELRFRLIEAHPDAARRPKIPSLSTVQRYIAYLDGDRKTTGHAEQNKSKSKSPDGRFRSRLATAPGDECQVDTTTFDSFVKLPDGTVGRPCLSVLVCKRTRSIMAHNFTAGAPTGFDHAVLVARALVPRTLRPWARHYEDLDFPEMPWTAHLDEAARRQFDTRRPYIVPQRIITDNGRDYTSEALRSVCARYGISLTESPIVSPTSKAQVERIFGTIGTKFAQFLPGYSGSRTEFRGEQPEKEAVLDLATVSDLFDRWVAIVWQNRVHDGLIDPYDPSVRHTPNSMFSASLEFTGYFPVPLQPEDYVALMPKETRTVQSDGIEFRGRRYDSAHLAPLRDHHDANGKKTRFDVHYDPSDIHQVWVRSPYNSEWVTCSWTETEGMSRPFERAYMDTVTRITATSHGFTDDTADDMTLTLRADITREEKDRKAADAAALRAAARAAARAETSTIGRHSAATEAPTDTFTPMGSI